MDNQDFSMSIKKSSNKNLPVTLTLEHVSPVTRLLEKRKQMLSVQENLDSEKESYQRKEEIFKRREENLRKKDLELQEALVLFNKFLKENEQKRRRAEHRANEEYKKKLKWEKELVNRKLTLEKLRQKCEHVKQLLRKNDKYQVFLQQVHEEHGNHFDEIASIMSRYKTLDLTNKDLIRSQSISLSKNEKLRSQFSQFKKDQYNTTLSLNNEIAYYSRLLEDAVKTSADIEENMISTENMEALRKRETTQIILAADNLYQRCRRVVQGIIKHGARKLTLKQKANMEEYEIKKQETIMKLETIKTYIIDFDDIVSNISGGQQQILNGINSTNGNGNGTSGNERGGGAREREREARERGSRSHSSSHYSSNHHTSNNHNSSHSNHSNSSNPYHSSNGMSTNASSSYAHHHSHHHNLHRSNINASSGHYASSIRSESKAEDRTDT